MPKKFSRYDRQKKELKNDEKLEEVDETVWEETDKRVKKKQQRKEENSKKREQQLARKAESKKFLEQETTLLKSSSISTQKVTRAQIQSSSKRIATKVSESLPENVNRMKSETIVARSVDDAISIFEDRKDEEKHPEKRRKAAFIAFENSRIQQLKCENPNLRLSQMKEMVFKEWQKSTENPINQV